MTTKSKTYSTLNIREKACPLKFSTCRISSQRKHPAVGKRYFSFIIPLISSSTEQKYGRSGQEAILSVPPYLSGTFKATDSPTSSCLTPTDECRRRSLSHTPSTTQTIVYAFTHRRGLLLRCGHRHSFGEQLHRHVVATHTL